MLESSFSVEPACDKCSSTRIASLSKVVGARAQRLAWPSATNPKLGAPRIYASLVNRRPAAETVIFHWPLFGLMLSQ